MGETYAGERHLHGKIYGRPKHIYSIYVDAGQEKRFDEIYDLIAIRCIWRHQAMSMLCWAISMSSGNQCRVL